MKIDNKFISKLLSEAAENPRLRQNYDMRTSSDDNSQRMLNALLPGTVVPIHRHPHSTENVLLLHGKLVEVFYEEERCGDGIEPGDSIEQKQDMAIGRASMKRHALSWTVFRQLRLRHPSRHLAHGRGPGAVRHL